MGNWDRLLERSDRFHSPAPLSPNLAWAKEWHHFCLHVPGLDVVVNLNLSGDTRPAAPVGATVARTILLVRTDEWDGDLDTAPRGWVSIADDRIGLTFGPNALTFRDGAYHLSLALENLPITLQAAIVPQSSPRIVRSDVPIGEGTINWLVVPRLTASGRAVVGDRVFTFENAPAYHDHNWGRWLWGHDFAWEWGYALASEGDASWTMLFDRTTNRSRNRALETTLAFWRGEDLRRVFVHNEVRIEASGHLDPERLFKVPRVMALVSPERTTDIPRSLRLSARRGEDWAEACFDAEDACQVVIPNDLDLGITIINEVCGRVSVSGRVGGEEFGIEGRGTFEFLT